MSQSRAMPGSIESTSNGRVSCPACGSENVHRSHSSYPMDEVRLAGRSGGFWRCQHCGDRFIGPPHDQVAGESPHHGHRRRRHDSELDRSIRFERKLRRWLFPVIVLALTVLAVLFILERRNRQVQEEIHEVN